MRQISSMLHGLARSMSLGKERKEAEEGHGTVLRSSGTLWGEGSETFAAACSRRGEKGSNQDTSIVWEVLGYGACLLPLGVSFCSTGGIGQKRDGIRVPGRHHLLRRLRRPRPVGPLRRQGRPGIAAAVASVPLAGGRRADVAHRRREEAQRLSVRPPEAVVPGRRGRRGRGAPPKPAPRRRQQRLHGSVHRQAGRPDGGRERRRLAGRPRDHVGRRRRRRRPAHRRFQARLTPGEGAHHAVQGPRALPRRRARRAPGVGAPPGGSGAGHVARVRRLLRQGLRRDLDAGGDAEEDHRPGPVHHPGHRRGLGRALQRGGRADRGRDAGQGEGGEAPRRVRRPRVEAQAAGHRRRRLLGGLPLLPLAVVLSKLPGDCDCIAVRARGKQPVHLLVDRSVRDVAVRERPVSDQKVQFAS